MRLPGLHKVPHSIRYPEVIIPHHRKPLFVTPDQIPHILCRSRDNIIRRRHARNNWRYEPNQYIPVPTDNTPRHRSHEDVNPTRQHFLIRLFRWGQRGYGGSEAMLRAEEGGHAAVHGVFGYGGVVVGEEARFADLVREAVGW